MVENFSAGNAEEPPEYIEESANPATSVHAAVVMDGNMSEGDTDLSSMRRYGAEGSIDCVVRQSFEFCRFSMFSMLI